ncbi:hypothetical protein Poli38472_005909 [Pythium oligandrum]|uniref:Guanidinoacetate N-methyltransferase n=1 Tax=Pythium oligandrum TaxID=41045 RepID=A0A8K1CTQ8_PYTOL|nr:hypothetical protein Poli38472_005909 [Pythium oligandrum]|eukprot:TMW68441.1 hypothetical protein Poli38472_005909 [Pythium oligandrum]
MVTKGNAYGRDEHGKAIVWSSQGQQVMMEWEKAYMEACVDALGVRSTDRVLEIGFGLAYSATQIQTYRPASHTIIECDQAGIQQAQAFAEANGQEREVVVVQGTWQAMLPTLGTFDCVFFDDYPLPELEETTTTTTQTQGRSRWHDFLDVVLPHCVQGARITGYLARDVGLTRAGCDVHVRDFVVDAPANCTYYPHEHALVPVITVTDDVVARNCVRQRVQHRLDHVRGSLLVQAVEHTHSHATNDDSMDAEDNEESRYASYGSRREFLAALRHQAGKTA